MKVYLDAKDRTQPRRLVEVEVISESTKAFKVRLPDGNIITRKKSRDIPKEPETEEKKGKKK